MKNIKNHWSENPIKRKFVIQKLSRTRKKLIKEGKLIVWNQREENVAKRPEVKKKLKENHWSRNPLIRDTVMEQLSSTQFKKGHQQSPKINKKKGSLGSKNARWIDGRSFKPYGSEFNKALKEKIKKRHNYTCQLCNDKIKKQTKKKFLTVHHIDYNKLNSNENNLIALCNFCNSSVNTNRNQWTKHFQNKIKNG